MADAEFDPNADRLREECGVFGIFGHPDAAAITALGLHALQHRGQEAAGISAGGVFLGTLLIVSIITARISDMVLDSRVGALDRTLGFLFGLGRGLIIVVVAFLFFAWLVPDRSQPDWVRGAKSKVVLQNTGQWLMSMLPDDPESTILKRLKKPKPDDQDTPDTSPDRRSELMLPMASGTR